MIGVGFSKGGKITLDASYGDNEFELAVSFGESLARHNKGTVVVFLYKKGIKKVKILKKIRLVNTGFLGLRRKVVTK